MFSNADFYIKHILNHHNNIYQYNGNLIEPLINHRCMILTNIVIIKLVKNKIEKLKIFSTATFTIYIASFASLICTFFTVIVMEIIRIST